MTAYTHSHAYAHIRTLGFSEVFPDRVESAQKRIFGYIWNGCGTTFSLLIQQCQNGEGSEGNPTKEGHQLALSFIAQPVIDDLVGLSALEFCSVLWRCCSVDRSSSDPILPKVLFQKKWRKNVTGQLAIPGSPRKRMLKPSVCVWC